MEKQQLCNVHSAQFAFTKYVDFQATVQKYLLLTT